jgi:hypothetical protein
MVLSKCGRHSENACPPKREFLRDRLDAVVEPLDKWPHWTGKRVGSFAFKANYWL